MSTNKTQNYQLHAWEPADDFLRAEFNENFAKLDGAARFVFGAYAGNSANNGQRIELGFKPKAVLVCSTVGSSLRSTNGNALSAIAGQGRPVEGCLTLDETGFTVSNWFDRTLLNTTGYSYYYIALY